MASASGVSTAWKSASAKAASPERARQSINPLTPIMKKPLHVVLAALLLAAATLPLHGAGPVRPHAANPWYWEYHDKPVVLVGASHRDNLFQWTGQQLVDHLELLVSVGGNYVRCTLSDRNPGDIYAFRKVGDDLYDLTQWNDPYWERLRFFLQETQRRGIIVQMTLWDQFDLAGGNWLKHPWAPDRNVNYDTGVIASREDFYDSVRAGNKVMLDFQKRFINRVLELTLRHDNVLYNINNESSKGPVWENFWARHITAAAAAAGREAHVTSMQFDPSNSVRHVMTYPDAYSFIEISQNNQDSRGARGQAHWDNILFWRHKVANMPGGPRPMNNEKVYGGGDGYRNYSSGTSREAEARFWRNIFAGCASSRFHRDVVDWGIGLTERAQLNLRAMRSFLQEVDMLSSQPHNDLISVRVPVRGQMEAYVTASIGSHYAVYFPAGRYTVDLDPWVYVDQLRLRWLSIEDGQWSEPVMVKVEWEGSQDDWGHRGRVRLETPSNRAFVALLEVVDPPSTNLK
jgi:hypothetical protein